jgi:hypothetical protein
VSYTVYLDPAQVRAAASDLHRSHDDLDAVAHTLRNLPCVVDTVFGDYGVPAQQQAFWQAWLDEVDLTVRAVGQTADAVGRQADRSEAVDLHAAHQIRSR